MHLLSLECDMIPEEDLQQIVAFRINSKVQKKMMIEERMKEILKIVTEANPQLVGYI